MSLEEKVAQLFAVTPEQLFDSELVTEPDDSMAAAFAERPVAALIFFGDNLLDFEQTRDMLAGIKSSAEEAGVIQPFLCVDEEGGLVQRVGGRPEFDAPYIDHASAIGSSDNPSAAGEAATDIAHKLLDLGFDVDFAPSCDVSSGPSSIMHRRSFSTDAAVVATMAVEEIVAFEDAGILCCAKHFPGIGDPEEDSHDGSISTDKTRDELEMQLIPFRAAIEVDVPFVMVSHLAAPEVTGSSVPSSLSPQIVQGLLREDLGYGGIVITDSLSMGAVGEYANPDEVAVMAIEAGCDIALMPPDFDAAYTGLLDAVAEGRVSESRIDESLARIMGRKLNQQDFDA